MIFYFCRIYYSIYFGQRTNVYRKHKQYSMRTLKGNKYKRYRDFQKYDVFVVIQNLPFRGIFFTQIFFLFARLNPFYSKIQKRTENFVPPLNWSSLEEVKTKTKKKVDEYFVKESFYFYLSLARVSFLCSLCFVELVAITKRSCKKMQQSLF